MVGSEVVELFAWTEVRGDCVALFVGGGEAWEGGVLSVGAWLLDLRFEPYLSQQERLC